MNDINLDTNNPNNDKTDDDDDDDESDREPPPPRLSLVRESGSVTPRHGRKTTLGSRLAQQQQQQQQQEEQPLRLQSPLKHSPVKHIIVLESSEEQRPVSMQHDQPLSTPPTPPMDSLLGTFPSVPLLLDDNDRGQSVPMPLPPPPPSHAEATNRPVHDKQQHRQTRRVDSGMSPKQIRGSSGGNTNASSSYKKSFFPSISLDSMEEDAQEEEEEKEHQHISIPNENNLVPKESISVLVSNTITPAVSNDASLRRSTSNEEYQNGATNVNPDDRRDVQGKEEQQQQQRIEKLEKRCKELKKLLGHAENHILELQQQNTNLADTSEHDRLLVQNHLAETEARLTQASTELRDQEVIAMRKECGDQIKAMERQLVEVRMSFEQDRHHLETLLAEAINRGKNAEELAREEKSSSDKSSSEAHQNQARALRLTEDKLVQAMAMLDERMESETNLKERIKALESKLSEQTAGAAESEQEMAALDTENENLHDLVEKLKVETLELRKQVANVEGDSDKLVHLRVRTKIPLSVFSLLDLIANTLLLIPDAKDGVAHAERRPQP